MNSGRKIRRVTFVQILAASRAEILESRNQERAFGSFPNHRCFLTLGGRAGLGENAGSLSRKLFVVTSLDRYQWRE